MKNYLIILFAAIQTTTVFSQQLSNWKNYNDMKQINALHALNEGIWAASSGGGFYYDLASKVYKKINKTDGLFATNLTAVCVDNFGKIWFGSSNGAINVFNPSDNSMQTILDIYNSDRVKKQINELRVLGDTIYVSTEFGLSLINSKSLAFYDTYYKFGNLASNVSVVSTFKTNLIFAATEFGIAAQKVGATNLSAPESWNIQTTSNGLPSNIIRKVRLFNNDLIAATDKGIARFNGTSWESFVPNLANKSIIDIFVSNDTLYISHENSISIFTHENLTTIFNSSFEIRKISISSSGIYVSSSQGIVRIGNDNNYSIIVPNGPGANQFPGMSVDNDGVLWCASGKDNRGAGFYYLNGNEWTTTNILNSSIPNNDYHITYSAPDNSSYIGSWGFGFVRLKNNIMDIFLPANLPFQGIPENTAFKVVTGFGYDSKDNLWVLSYGAADRKPLSMLTKDSVWFNFSIPSETNIYFKEHFNLAVDNYDTKWFCIQDERKAGLFYFNENKTNENTSDDFSGYLSKTSGLNDNTINSIVVDKRGDLWVGTSLGVNIVTNLSSALSNNPQFRISSVFALRQQTINCIAVDPLNQKWVGTNQGLLLVNSDGSRLIATYDSKNSALPSDLIRSIAVDENNGIVYVGTDEGLTSFETPAVKPLDTFADLFVYPNPFHLTNADGLLTIDGLVKDSKIKILNISGKLITEFSSPGGRVAYWDGKDFNGTPVNSGIYLIVAFDQDGNNAVTAKVAVFKRN